MQFIALGPARPLSQRFVYGINDSESSGATHWPARMEGPNANELRCCIAHSPGSAGFRDGGRRVIRLYHCTDARSFRPLWALEELGLRYELIVMPFPPRYRAKEFMAINPLGTVPALVDGETFMTESAAIVQYIATRCSPSMLAIDVSDSAYGAWLNWLHFGEATLTFPQTLVLRYRRLEPGRAEIVADDYAKWFLARLRAVDRALREADYLCAGRFTAADISVGYALLLAEQLGLNSGFTAPIAAYWAMLQARAGFQAAKAAQVKHAPVNAEAVRA
jgi:glutathione S-transferase